MSELRLELEGSQIEPYLSAYLMGGFRDDVPRIERVTLDGKQAVAHARLTSFYVSENDNRFHLSMVTGTLLITQAGLIHGLAIANREKKGLEVYMSDFSISLTRQLVKPELVKISLDLINKIVVPPSGQRRHPRTFYRWRFSIDDDVGTAWSGLITLVFPF